jgi:single-strand DNA-binding protein
MRSLNRVELIGNLSRDAETKFLQTGTAVTKFSIVTNRSWKNKQSGEWEEEANFTNCVLWAAESLANYLVKGKQIYVEGRLSNRKYEKDGVTKYTTEVVVESVILLGGGKDKKDDSGGHKQPERSRQGAQQPAGDGWGDSDWGGNSVDPNDVPF